MEEHLKKKQKELDELYEKHGLTDEVLDQQIAINKLRHAHNITDETETVHEDFVQQVIVVDNNVKFRKILGIQNEQRILNKKVVVEGWTLENTAKQQELDKELELIKNS